MAKHGRKKRSRRRARGSAARRAGAWRGLGGIPLGLLARDGLVSPSTGTPPEIRARATPAERAHVEALRAQAEDLDS